MEQNVYFKGVKYKIGNQVGYRPAEGDNLQQVKDLAFATEIVNEKRLANSPEEVLNILKLAQEVGMAKVAEDGRPRVLSKQIKYYRSFSGKLDAPNAGWNETCSCQVKASILTGSKVMVEGTFKNVNAAVKATVTNIIYAGATSGKYVVKGDKAIIVQGTNMMFIATGDDKDNATIQVGNGTVRELTCTASDTGSATFAWPAGLTVNDGDTATIIITSHAGIAGNDPTVNKKTVICLAADPVAMTVQATTNDAEEVDCYHAGHNLIVKGLNFEDNSKLSVVFTATGTGDTVQRTLAASISPTDNGTKFTIANLESINTIDNTKPLYIVVEGSDGSATSPRMTYTEV